MRKTYSYTGAGVIGALLGLLVWASTESLVLGILTFIGAGVVAFVMIRAIEIAIYNKRVRKYNQEHQHKSENLTDRLNNSWEDIKMKLLKNALSLVLALALCLSLAAPALAADTISFGDCGLGTGNVSWALDSAGTLTISGKGCMKNYTYDGEAPWYNWRDSILSVVVENGIVNVGDYAFADCEKLTSVILADSVTGIGKYAFGWCRSLVQITLPNWLNTISDDAFVVCDHLSKITMPGNLSGIGAYAFSDCYNLGDVFYKGTADQWKSLSVLNGNDSLTSATLHLEAPVQGTVPANNSGLATISLGNCGLNGGNVSWELDASGTLKISGSGGMVNYTYDGEAPWYNWRNNILSIVVERGVVSIGDYAFADCEKLTNIILADSVTSIGKYAFGWCRSLVQITLPDPLNTIGDDAFVVCDHLSKVTLSGNLSGIGAYAFSDCYYLGDVFFKGTADQWRMLSVGSGNDSFTSATLHLIEPPAKPTNSEETNPAPDPAQPEGNTTNNDSAQPGGDTTNTDSGVHFEKRTIYYPAMFTDIPENQWYTNSVASAFEYGLMKGDSDTTFNPYGDVTVAEAVTMAARIHSIYTTGAENFVQSGSTWYQVYLDYAYKHGIISRAYYNSDVTHKATRAQFAEIFANSLPAEALAAINSVSDNGIPDVPMTAGYAQFVYRLYRAGILTGSDANGTFNPQTYITRAEAAAIVSRMAESGNRVSITL